MNAHAARINQDVAEMNRAAPTLERYKTQGYDAVFMTPEQMRADLQTLTSRAAAVFRRLGVAPQ
jgi:hypothetical protein